MAWKGSNRRSRRFGPRLRGTSDLVAQVDVEFFDLRVVPLLSQKRLVLLPVAFGCGGVHGQTLRFVSVRSMREQSAVALEDLQLDGPSMRTKHLGLDAPAHAAAGSPSVARISGIGSPEFPEPTAPNSTLGAGERLGRVEQSIALAEQHGDASAAESAVTKSTLPSAFKPPESIEIGLLPTVNAALVRSDLVAVRVLAEMP